MSYRGIAKIKGQVFVRFFFSFSIDYSLLVQIYIVQYKTLLSQSFVKTHVVRTVHITPYLLQLCLHLFRRGQECGWTCAKMQTGDSISGTFPQAFVL